MTIVAAFLTALLVSAPCFVALFLSGMAFWPAFFTSWALFLTVVILFLLVACGADLGGTVRRSR